MVKRPSVKDRLKRFFLDNQGLIVNSQQLQEVAAPNTEWARRIRELRGDEGWPIQTQNDSTELGQGEYRLVREPPAPGTYIFTRRVSQAQRARILERNGYTCQSCGATVGDLDTDRRLVRLHVDHHEAHSFGGTINDGNLRVLCSACNQGARNFTAQPPAWIRLLSQIRRASRGDQAKALEWLREKFDGSVQTEREDTDGT